MNHLLMMQLRTDGLSYRNTKFMEDRSWVRTRSGPCHACACEDQDITRPVAPWPAALVHPATSQIGCKRNVSCRVYQVFGRLWL